MSFVCPICNASFQSKGALVKHIKNLHPGSEVIIPRKIRNSAVEEPVLVAPIVAPEPVVTSVPIVNNEVEILKAQHAHEIEMLNAQHQTNLEIQALRLELEFVKSQNELLKGLLNKALDRSVEVASISRGPVVSEPVVSEPAVSEPAVSEPENSEKKVSNNKQIPEDVLNELNTEKPDAQNVGETEEFLLADNLGIFRYDRNNTMLLSNDLTGMSVYKYIKNKESINKWIVNIIKKFVNLDISPYHIINKKIYVKNDDGNWVKDNNEFKMFISMLLYKLSKAINNEDRLGVQRTNIENQIEPITERVANVFNISLDDFSFDSKNVKTLYNLVLKD